MFTWIHLENFKKKWQENQWSLMNEETLAIREYTVKQIWSHSISSQEKTESINIKHCTLCSWKEQIFAKSELSDFTYVKKRCNVCSS